MTEYVSGYAYRIRAGNQGNLHFKVGLELDDVAEDKGARVFLIKGDRPQILAPMWQAIVMSSWHLQIKVTLGTDELYDGYDLVSSLDVGPAG